MVDFFAEIYNKFVNGLIAVLPTSPFADYIEQLRGLPYLNFLNWFIPIDKILIVLSAWLGAIALFYIYSIVMRWTKMIGD